MCQTLISEGECIFQDYNISIYSVGIVNNWYEEHETELELKELAPQSGAGLDERVVKIPIEEAKKLCDYIQRRIEAVLKDKEGSTPYIKFL